VASTEIGMILPRVNVPRDDWDAFVEAHPDGWVWHLSAWLSYLKAAGREDASVARLDGAGEVIGICPALLPVPPDDPLPVALGEGWVTDWPTRGQPQQKGRAPGFATRVIDLSLPEADLWRGIRRSYHSPIHRAEERYTVALVPLNDLASLYCQQPDLPQIAPAQWDCLQRIENDGRLLCYGAISEDGVCVGAIGIYVWKGWAYYGHGRSLVPHVNAALHWHAMRALPVYGVRHYEIGWEARPEDDAKARAIAFHKQGLGGERWWVSVT